ncbi:MAG: alpha-glucan family phosphorylase [Desulfobulbaceae bacterium]|uniref:glycogen phosphorylase n=1 Tax=Candidatus Desulfobia pelagia TaxID=2841692 RepID=A0A8J6NCX4_9BACT|nr:alpha-glucan family phosphorylase [Candidatus Desulfobia pelagia]
MKVTNTIFPTLPQRIAGLGELAENLWWSWHPAARMLFKMLNRRRWKESIHNPDKMLKEMPPEQLLAASRDEEFLAHYDDVLSQFREYMAVKTCSLLHNNCPHDTPVIAYFSAEFGLHHSLPFYAGGLGFLAGDYLKECSDLNIPLVGVGFMYPEGYVSQRVSADGWQESVQFKLDREAASISRVIDNAGSPLVVRVPVIEPPIHVAVWKVSVGRVPLYLLDTDIEENDPWNRGISARLYAGDLELRLRQEIVLGIGGAEVLQALGIEHAVVHLNEGHAAFSLLERVRDRILQGLSLEDSLDKVRETTIFTTHTPVPAGHDIFPFPLIEKYFSKFWDSLGLDRETFLQLGTNPDEPLGFNMTAFALRLAGYKNGVSQKHGEVANRMWHNLWSDKSAEDGPIEAITNGVHVPTWIEPKMELLFNKYLPYGWLERHDDPSIWEKIDNIPDEELWKTYVWLKIKLLNVIRERARQRWSIDQVNPSMVIAGGAMLDPSVLTLGFARRFATYKRADLIFLDSERLKKMLKNRWKPLQIIFAGKAHPDDHPGKMILQKIVTIAKDPEFAGRIAFVEDYGEQFAQYLVHGVDVWLNNPIPPMEASGTSGMKASLNGVPSLSILDGWWLEGFSGNNGWAFGDEPITGDRSLVDANAIYEIIEQQIIPLYYDTSEDGIPVGWVKVMKNAIKQTGSHFSARRMVKEYVQKFYSQALVSSGKNP